MRTLAVVAICLVAAGLFLISIVGLSTMLIPASAVPDAPTRLKLQNDVRTTMLQSVGGLLLVVGAYFTWRQLQLGREQLRHSLETSTAQLQLSMQSQTTEQLSRSIEQLGHDKAGVRVGAVYALEQIARTSTSARPGIHELLAAYIRAESTWPHHDPETLVAIEPAPSADDLPELPLMKVRATDIQAALTALGRRTAVPGEAVELQSTDLRACYLGGLNFRGSFMGRAMLALADLTDADLSDAWLRRTNFRDAILIGCNLQNVVLRDAILRGANLSGANLCGADLSNADLTQANLQGISFDETTIWPYGFTPPSQDAAPVRSP